MTTRKMLRKLLFSEGLNSNPMARPGCCPARTWAHIAQLTTLLLLLALGSGTVFAQAGSGTIVGTVTDPHGAVVPNATVTITDKDTNEVTKATTNSAGQFVVPSMKPGRYEIKISKQGFQTAVIKDQTVEIAKQLTETVTLKVGVVTEEVTVTAEAVQLQTLDASVGNVLDEQALQKLPSLSRDATALLLLQPLAAPGFNSGPGYGETNLTGGGIAGARADQNTFLVDGGDATSNTEGGGGYAQQSGGGFSATPHASIPTPVESLEEFRVTTNNSSTFARSSGGEVQMVTRRGTNNWHGAVYENNQNNDFNANIWQLNKTGQQRPVWQDNRFGGRVGGPILKDKAFFFLMYEGERFRKGTAITRLVPSDLLKQGIVQFRDAGGVVRQYNLKTAACAGGPCDPRGLGLDPTISKIWGFEPTGNNTSEGDGLNTIGFDSTAPVIVHNSNAIGRLDYKLNPNWDINSSFRYSVSDGTGAGQVDIGGLLSGDTKGVPTATRTLPDQPRLLVVGATGRLTSNLTNDFHFDYLRHWWDWQPKSPFPQVAGLGAAVQIFSESQVNGLVPMNIDTQNARSRVWNGKDLTFNDNLAWVKGKHFFQFGGEFRHEGFFHSRDDKVVGALTHPVYFAEKGTKMTIGSAFQPVPCGGGVTTNCLQASDVSTWQSLYAAVTGMVDHGSQLLTRGPDFSPNAPGTPLTQHTRVLWYNMYFGDSWKVTPSFTVTYGLGWGAQTPPYEASGEQTIMTNAATGQPIVFADYLSQMAANAAQGLAYNPTLAFTPVKAMHQTYPYNTEWTDFDPRLAFAWNPSFKDSFLGRILGDKKSVIRAGYGRYHDRLNGVGLVMTPALGIGFGNTVVCNAPAIGGTCLGSTKSTPSNAFRIGTDGNVIPLPSLGPVTGSLIPGNNTGVTGANSPYELLDFRIDPHRKVGVEDTWTLSVQHELPWKSMIEIGYVGRVAHHLYGAGDIGQVPYMIKAGGQTFASAFDAVAKAVRAGQTPAAQPFFETFCAGSCTTASLVASNKSDFLNGLPTNIWLALDPGTNSVIDTQLDNEQITTSVGNSNYHAGYVSWRKQMSHGLLMQANYTWSHSFDTIGLTQENVFITPSDNFNPSRDYGPSLFDRRHTLNLFFVYDLPFGKGRAFSTNNWLDKVIGGWSFSGLFAAASGIPLSAINNASCEEFGNGDVSGNCSAMIPVNGDLSSSAHYNSNGTVTAFSALPTDAANGFRKLFFSDLRTGSGAVRSFPRWNMDSGLTKTTKMTERTSMTFGVQAVNLFNHMEFNDPGLDISNPTKFGVTSTQYSQPRFLNLSIRVDF